MVNTISADVKKVHPDRMTTVWRDNGMQLVSSVGCCRREEVTSVDPVHFPGRVH